MKLKRQSAWLFFLVAVIGYLPGKPSPIPSTFPDEKYCQLELTGRHHHLYCLDEVRMENLSVPVVNGSCMSATTLSYQERYDDLGCGANGFTGYFEPSRWMVSKIYGDGGVDVTGAPNALLVEGADNTLVSATPGGATRIQILIPADGIVAFDWRSIGGSHLFSNSFQVSINEEVFSLTEDHTSKGRFRRPVRTGDELSFHLKAPEPLSFELDNFRLLTNAIGAFQRVWTATDELGRHDTFTQFITIEQPSIVEVIFPGDREEVPATSNATSPQATGFPYFDRDGDPATTDDHYRLQENNCAYQVEYTDELQRLGDACVLFRRWTITDACGNNTLQETQVIRLKPVPASGDCPGELLPLPEAPESSSPETLPEEISSSPYSAGKNDENDPMTL